MRCPPKSRASRTSQRLMRVVATTVGKGVGRLRLDEVNRRAARAGNVRWEWESCHRMSGSLR